MSYYHLVVENDAGMTPAQLWRSVVELGECIEPEPIENRVVASLMLMDDHFIMEGWTGSHQLDLAHTSADRLFAHWTTFKAANRARLKAPHENL